MDETLISDEVRALLREHLVGSAEVARRCGVNRAAVTQWLSRHPELEELVVARASGPLFLWPEMKNALDRLGLPGKARKGES